MAKKIDIVQAFIWASNILDTNQLSLADQAVFFNILKLINRNFWKPIKISAFKLGRQMCSDQRTIKKSLKSLAEKKIIYMNITDEIKMEGDIYIGNIAEEHFKSLISKSTDQSTDSANVIPDGNTASNSTTSTTNTETRLADSKTLADF